MGGGGGSGREQIDHPEERMLAEIAKEQWADYKTKYKPVEQAWMDKVSTLDSNNEHFRAAGLASAEFTQANRGAFDERREFMAGGAGQRVGGDIAGATGTMNNATQIMNRSSLGVTDRYVRGMESIVGIGQGTATEGLRGLSDVAETAVQGRIDNDKNRFERKEGDRELLGALGGATGRMALGAFGKSKKGDN
jgi:hypothetical protein